MREDIKRFLTLSPAAAAHFVADSEEDLHGYGNYAGMARHTKGNTKMGPGKLYDNLAKNNDAACVEEVQRRAEDGDPRGVIIATGRAARAFDRSARLEGLSEKRKDICGNERKTEESLMAQSSCANLYRGLLYLLLCFSGSVGRKREML